MSSHVSRIPLASVVSMLVLICSCDGQGRADAPRGVADSSHGTPVTRTTDLPKLVRTRGLPSGNILAEMQDRRGNIWFSAGGEGAFRFDGTSFTNFTSENGLPDDGVGSIIETRAGDILATTGSGIFRHDGVGFSRYAPLDSLADKKITDLFEDRDGNLWIATMGNGIYRFDGRSLANFLNDDRTSYNLGNDDQLILDIHQARNGDLWFSSWNRGGVWRYDGTTFTNYLPAPEYYQRPPLPATTIPFGRSATITDDMIYSIAEDRAGNLWFATRDHGVARYDGTTFTTIWRSEGFDTRGAYSILEDRRGDIWLTTDKDGVWRYDGRTFANYTTRDGLAHNSVFSVLEDRDGNLWFGTRGFGLSRYDGTRFTTLTE